MVSGVLCCVAESPVQWLLALEEPAAALTGRGLYIYTLPAPGQIPTTVGVCQSGNIDITVTRPHRQISSQDI